MDAWWPAPRCPGPAHAARRRARRQAAGRGGAGRAARAAGPAGGRARAGAALLGARCGRPAAGALGNPQLSCTRSHDTRHGLRGALRRSTGAAPAAAVKGWLRAGWLQHMAADEGACERFQAVHNDVLALLRARRPPAPRCPRALRQALVAPALPASCWCCMRGCAHRPPRSADVCGGCARRMRDSMPTQCFTADTAMRPGRPANAAGAPRREARVCGVAAGGVQCRVLGPKRTLVLHRPSGWTRCRRAGSCHTARTTTRRARCAACSSRSAPARWTRAWPRCAPTRPRCARWPPSSASTPRRAAQRRTQDNALRELHDVTPWLQVDELQRPPPQVPAWPVKRSPGLCVGQMQGSARAPHVPALSGACERWVHARGRQSSRTRPSGRWRAPRTRTRRPQRCECFRDGPAGAACCAALAVCQQTCAGPVLGRERGQVACAVTFCLNAEAGCAGAAGHERIFLSGCGLCRGWRQARRCTPRSARRAALAWSSMHRCKHVAGCSAYVLHACVCSDACASQHQGPPGNYGCQRGRRGLTHALRAQYDAAHAGSLGLAEVQRYLADAGALVRPAAAPACAAHAARGGCSAWCRPGALRPVLAARQPARSDARHARPAAGSAAAGGAARAGARPPRPASEVMHAERTQAHRRMQGDLAPGEAEAVAREALAAADGDGDGRLALDEFAGLAAAQAARAAFARPELLAALGPTAEGAPSGCLTREGAFARKGVRTAQRLLSACSGRIRAWARSGSAPARRHARAASARAPPPRLSCRGRLVLALITSHPTRCRVRP